jgi:predicted nucleic acid-binding Zn ribbon protein
MPLFDYVCADPECDATVERIVRDPEVAEVTCPECAGPMVATLPKRLAAHCYGAGIYKPSLRD